MKMIIVILIMVLIIIWILSILWWKCTGYKYCPFWVYVGMYVGIYVGKCIQVYMQTHCMTLVCTKCEMGGLDIS